MIFLSLGTHEQPFTRAIEKLRPAAVAGEALVIQHGFTEPDATMPGVTWVKFVEFGEMVRLLTESRAFISHAGVGSILTALTHGVTPIVLPREARYGEHVDDHQLDLVHQLASRSVIVQLQDDVEAAIAEASLRNAATRAADPRLAEAVVAAAANRGGLLRRSATSIRA